MLGLKGVASIKTMNEYAAAAIIVALVTGVCFVLEPITGYLSIAH
jgi:hypothetical protein